MEAHHFVSVKTRRLYHIIKAFHKEINIYYLIILSSDFLIEFFDFSEGLIDIVDVQNFALLLIVHRLEIRELFNDVAVTIRIRV